MSEEVALVERMTAPRPAAVEGGGLALPRLVVDAGPAAVGKFLEFFAARIANRRTRAAYGRAVGQFLACPCLGRRPRPRRAPRRAARRSGWGRTRERAWRRWSRGC